MTASFVGFHYDIARTAYLKPPVFRDALRHAAHSGFTHFVPYLENMICLPSTLKACPACAYTAEDWRSFESTARESGIELVPHFNVIGHTERFTHAYPRLTAKEAKSEMDPRRPWTRAWTLRCLEEFCAISSGRYFLIGGDEWQAPRHLLARSDCNPGQEWVEQVNLAVRLLVAQGRIPIVWHDMLCHYPETLTKLSRKAVVAFWFYDWDSDYAFLKLLKALGFRTIMASGMIGGNLSRRRVTAVRSAIQAFDRRQADGFLMTAWEDARWETVRTAMTLTGRALRHEPLPKAVLDAISIQESWSKVQPNSTVAHGWRRRCLERLEDSAWNEFPHHRVWLRARLQGDRAQERATFRRFHHPQGDLYAALGKPRAVRRPPVCAPSVQAVQSPLGVALETWTSPEGATGIRISHDDETFVVYPDYGASLQDWRKGRQTIIPHSYPAFAQQGGGAAGGYRSFSAVGGFRPIWALGTHHNPCILWQYPYRWKIVAQTASQMTLCLCRSFYHVDIRYCITVEQGRSGFRFIAEATNRLPLVYAAFGWNLPLFPARWRHVSFQWKEAGRRRQTSLEQQVDSAFPILARDGLSVGFGTWDMAIHTDPAQTAGYFVDWSTTFVTPDLRGRYIKQKAGQITTATWDFRVAERKRF